MKLKKIDTESKIYNNIRNGIGIVSGLGAGFAFEAMSIPWFRSIFRSRLMHIACFGGVVSISTLIMEIGDEQARKIVDAYACCWNDIADFVNELHDAEIDDEEPDDGYGVETKQTYVGFDIPGKNATPIEEKQFIADVVDAVRPFEFETEDEAKQFVEEVARYVNKFGHVDIAYAFAVAGRKLPVEVYDIALKFGWSKDDAKDWGVDKIAENVYIADIFNYHDISDTYQILDFKEE